MNLETKITIYKFTPQLFTLTHLLGKDRLHPIINVYPEENDIYNKLDSLLANPNFSIIRRQH